MKFTSYQNRAQLGAPASQVSNVHYSNPGALAAAKAEGELYTTIGKGITTYADTVSKTKALEANNYYNQRMSQETADLMQDHKEGEALNITELYDQKQKQVMDETQKKYGNYLKFGAGAQAFTEFTMRDNATRRANMQRYQMGETEKFQDTVFNNQVATTNQDVLAGGYSNMAIDGGLNRLEALTAERYAAYGKERVQAENRKLASQLAGTALGQAIAMEDNDRIDAIASRYQGILDPTARQRALAIRSKREQADRNAIFIQQGVKVLGNNASYDDCVNYVNANNLQAAVGNISSFYNQTKGMPYHLGGAEDGSDGTWDCGSWTKAACAKAGITLNSRCADDQYDQMLAEGHAFKDKAALKDGDLVFWTHTGGEEGDNGVAHVGIYDASTGKVMQSGTRGVGEIDLDTYDIVGFGHLNANGGKRLSPAEAKAQADALYQGVRKANAAQKAQDTEAILQGRLALEKARNEAVTNGGTLSQEDANSIVSQYLTGRDEVDVPLQTAALTAAGVGRSRSTGGDGAGTGKTPAGFKFDFANMLKSGKFESAYDAIKYVTESTSDGYYNKEMYNTAIQEIDDWAHHKKSFAIDDEREIKSAVIDRLGGNMTKYAGRDLEYEHALQMVYEDEYADYLQQHNRPPSSSQIVDWVTGKMLNTVEYTHETPGRLWGTNTENTGITEVQLRERGLKFKDFDDNGNYVVQDVNSAGTYSLTPEQFRKIADSNEYWADTIRAGED